MPHSETPLDVDAALVALAQVHVVPGDTPSAPLYEVAQIATTVLGVERFSVWCTSEARDAIRLYFLFCRTSGAISDGTILRQEDFPGYFAAMDGRTIAIDDVRTDPAATELLGPYLEPLGFSALLDAQMYTEGRVSGIVCHEHIGGARHWEAEQRHFAAAADNVSRLLADCAR